tara:strand:+ start:418 stop:648 length:231 start_codon:yes stop_codon:yes gene_type:complete
MTDREFQEFVFVHEDSKYGVTAEGELWVKGEHGYRAGYMMKPNDRGAFEVAVDNAEEELRCLRAEASMEICGESYD